DPRLHRTGDHWHIQVGGLPTHFRYGWRVDGPVGAGHRFDPRLVLLDPAAPALSDGAVWGQANGDRESKSEERKATTEISRNPRPIPLHPPSAVPDPRTPPAKSTQRRSLFFRKSFNWHGDIPPLIPLEDSIVYELHVRGFTCLPSSGVAQPGTFSGLM